MRGICSRRLQSKAKEIVLASHHQSLIFQILIAYDYFLGMPLAFVLALFVYSADILVFHFL